MLYLLLILFRWRFWGTADETGLLIFWEWSVHFKLWTLCYNILWVFRNLDRKLENHSSKLTRNDIVRMKKSLLFKNNLHRWMWLSQIKDHASISCISEFTTMNHTKIVMSFCLLLGMQFLLSYNVLVLTCFWMIKRDFVLVKIHSSISHVWLIVAMTKY